MEPIECSLAMRNDERRGITILLTLMVFLAGYGILFLTGVTNIRHLLDNVISAYLLAWALYGMFARVPLSETGSRFLLTTGSLVFCWLLAEGAVMIGAIDFRTLLGAYEPGTALSMEGRRYDKELLWRHDPHYQYEASYQGNLGGALCIPPDPTHKIDVRYDHNGFRNARDLHEAELVVIGDSYIEGYLTPESKLITTVLSELQGTSVANLGHSGYGPQQELAVFRRFGLPLKPKTVVWAFFEGNDFSDSLAYERQAYGSGNDFWQNFWFRSLTRNVAALMFRQGRQCIPKESITEFRAEFIDAEHMTKTILFAPTEVAQPSGPTLHNAIAPIVEAALLCREQNIRFLVAFVPEKFRVYHDLHNVSLTTDAVRQLRVTDLPDHMRRLLTELVPTIEYVDLTPALKSATRAGIATYLADDTHWTDEGNRIAADTIHRALRKNHADRGLGWIFSRISSLPDQSSSDDNVRHGGPQYRRLIKK